MFVLVGSRATALIDRPKNDWDFLCTPDEAKKFYSDISCHVRSFVYREKPSRFLCVMDDGEKLSFDVDSGSSRLIYDYCNSHPYKRTGQWHGGLINFINAPLPVLFYIKKSHIIVPRNWEKHIEDYHVLKYHLNNAPYLTTLHTEMEKIYQLRRKEVLEWNKFPKVNLEMSNEEFFGRTKNVKRYCEHDDIHRATCYYDEPLYDKLKKDRSKAAIDRKKFNALSPKDQLRVVREEAYAIALERYVLPQYHDGKLMDSYSSNNYYLQALKRISTTLTSGWFREFALEHYPQLKQPEVDYIDKFFANFKPSKGAIVQDKFSQLAEEIIQNNEGKPPADVSAALTLLNQSAAIMGVPFKATIPADILKKMAEEEDSHAAMMDFDSY